jgi:hypothetical protein
MRLRLEQAPTIDNLRKYPAGTVEKLRGLLTAGAEARPDPHRKNFYDVENGSEMFYIHIAPSGKVLLLAKWPTQLAEARVTATAFAAQPLACRG